MLRADDISAGYPPADPVLTDASLRVPGDTTVGLLGPSGSGKSTLARVLALLHVPASGTVTVDDVTVRRWRYRAPRSLRTRIGIVFQQPRTAVDPRLRLHDVIAEPLRAAGLRRDLIQRVAELAELTGITDELLTRRANEVSDGQLQRVCLARALAPRPAYLICDEMTGMLDASTTAALVDVVQQYRARMSAGVLAISHDTTLLRHWCDHVESLAPEPSHRAHRPDNPTCVGSSSKP